MKAVVIADPGKGVEAWKVDELAEPTPGPGQVLVRMRAVSLNYRDLLVAKGEHWETSRSGLVVASDGAGEVVALGPGVAGWRQGDRVASMVYPTWRTGPYVRSYDGTSPGEGDRDGVLAEYVLLPADGVAAVPSSLSFEEAATLPCAALTAWHMLFEGASKLSPGASVLVQGTGGVSLFASQLALISGLRVIATSSSDRKLERLQAMGVRDLINYRAQPEWQEEVLRLTGSEGVELVLDVGGATTLSRSLQAVRVGGRICVIGVLGGKGGTIDPLPILARTVLVEGQHVGSVAMFGRMVRAIERFAIKPVIDEVFDLAQAPRALAKLAAGEHFGKIVVRLP